MFGLLKKLSHVGPALIVAVALLVVFPLTSPAQGKNATNIDEMRSTDAEIVKALADLDRRIAAQQAELDAANQSIQAAEQSTRMTEARIADLEKRLELVRQLAIERALNEYMQPSAGFLAQLLVSKGFDDASRRTELLRELNGRNFNAVDEMRAINRDLVKERKQSSEAKQLAESRRDSAQSSLDDLKRSRDEKARAEKELKARIAAAAEEDSIQRRADPATANLEVSASGLTWPIKGKPIITSPFGMRWGRMHQGIDVGVSTGTPLYAVKDGTVTWAGVESGYGNFVCIQHGGSFQTCNAHLSRIGVSKGQTVKQGDLIGHSGNTGASRGPHLHFETCVSNGPSCVYGTPKNPMNYLPKP